MEDDQVKETRSKKIAAETIQKNGQASTKIEK